MARASEKGEEKKQSNNQVEKLVEAPVEFVREGTQFLASVRNLI